METVCEASEVGLNANLLIDPCVRVIYVASKEHSDCGECVPKRANLGVIAEDGDQVDPVVGMWMGQADEVNFSIRDQLLNRRTSTSLGGVGIDNTNTAVRESDPDRFANSGLKKVNRQLSLRSVGGQHLGVRQGRHRHRKYRSQPPWREPSGGIHTRTGIHHRPSARFHPFRRAG